MELFAGVNSSSSLKNRYVFLDNDFLSVLYKNEKVFVHAIEFLKYSTVIIDPLTKFEFLRGIYVPGEKRPMENFINFFPSAVNHNDIFLSVQKNALALSTIYSHKGRIGGISTIDLLLAGRIMYHATNPLLITGNKKDFPSCIFDILSIFNIERPGDGIIQPFSVIEFNKEKFNNCVEDLKKIDKG